MVTFCLIFCGLHQVIQTEHARGYQLEFILTTAIYFFLFMSALEIKVQRDKGEKYWLSGIFSFLFVYDFAFSWIPIVLYMTVVAWNRI